MKKGARIPCDKANSLISQHYFFQSFKVYFIFYYSFQARNIFRSDCNELVSFHFWLYESSLI